MKVINSKIRKFTGYFIRNIHKDAEGRSIARMDGFQPDHELELVTSHGPYIVLDNEDGHLEFCEMMFAKFNRGSGHETVFTGPSMSVGDLVIIDIEGNPQLITYKCASFGFERLTTGKIRITLSPPLNHWWHDGAYRVTITVN